MQAAVPELCDLSGESEATKKLYGLDSPDKQTSGYARQCLLARRLVERGVRFVQLFDWGWDTHGTGPHDDIITQLPMKCRQVDQPITALIKDLKQRGMLEDTLVIWAGEFGRTPYVQGKVDSPKYGRDHHGRAFTVWMAGAGVKPGFIHGETDDFAYNILENPVHVNDLNATVLQCLGIDHERFTHRYLGLDQRLTGVEGAKVVKDILA